MPKMTVAQAFDEWMRKQKEDPSGFLAATESQALHEQLAEDRSATEYGNACAALLKRIMEHGAHAWKTDEELDAIRYGSSAPRAESP